MVLALRVGQYTRGPATGVLSHAVLAGERVTVEVLTALGCTLARVIELFRR